ncbi:hypothetical protein OROHE_001548 [Orobanche hederae]
MYAGQSSKGCSSSAEAVMLGALAPGVNGPTWNTVKIAFLLLGVCLAAMLGLAFSFSDSSLIFHVTFLVLIAGSLFLLLSSGSFNWGKEEDDPGELCREGNDGEIRHADSGSASGVGRGVRDENTIEKVEESIDGINHKETIMEEAADSVEDEGELMKKLGNERGGKPVDEVEGLDVYWRPIDENKFV